MKSMVAFGCSNGSLTTPRWQAIKDVIDVGKARDIGVWKQEGKINVMLVHIEIIHITLSVLFANGPFFLLLSMLYLGLFCLMGAMGMTVML